MNPIVVRLGGVPEHFNAPWHLSRAALLERGYDVQWTDFSSGTGALTGAMERGELDAALVLTEGILSYLLKGGAAKLAGTYVSSPLIWGLHVHASKPWQSSAELQGLRYAISRYGSGSHLMAFVSALERGWPADELEFVQVKNMEGARRSLAADTSDVFMWERFTTKPLVDSGEWSCVGTFSAPWPAFLLAVADHAHDRIGPHLPKILECVSEHCPKDEGPAPEFTQHIAQRYEQRLEDVEQWFAKTRWSSEATLPAEELRYTIRVLERSGILELEQEPALETLCSSWCELR